MKNSLPEIVTHNYDPSRGRFRNICDLPRSEAESILLEISDVHKSHPKANYLDRRLKVEEWLRSERFKMIGSTARNTPIYFFVGDFADGKDPLRPKSVRMPLDRFPEDVVTFTYSDSMSCFESAKTLDEQLPPFPRKLFTLKTLMDTVQKFGMPEHPPSEKGGKQPFIEMQLWDETPLAQLPI